MIVFDSVRFRVLPAVLIKIQVKKDIMRRWHFENTMLLQNVQGYRKRWAGFETAIT